MRICKLGIILVGTLIISFLSACGGGGGNTSSQIMKNVPASASSFSYWDVKTLGTKDATLVIYEKFKDSEEVIQLTNSQSGIGILSRSEINSVGRASGLGESEITLFMGTMDINGIKDKLGGRKDYTAEVLPKAVGTIWTPENTDLNKSIAIIDNVVLIGAKADILKCADLKASKTAESLTTDKNISLVLDRLPGGVFEQVYKAGTDPQESYEDMIAYGKSYSPEGKDELKITAVYMFQDYASTAIGKQDQISAYYKAKGFGNIKIERFDEKYLRVTATISISDFASILTW